MATIEQEEFELEMDMDQENFQQNQQKFVQNQIKIQEFRKNLPIFKHRKEIIKRFIQNRVSIVAGETGCGKTTQIPQYIYEENINKGKLIGITQPRRVAAITIAQRVSEEKGQKNVGDLVGYNVRFEEKYNKEKTKMLYMTDGMLLRECIVDQQLSRFSVIIIDEAHERTINSDILLSLLKNLLSKRTDLKIIIMSATIETEKFAKFFDQLSNIIYLEGRCHPIDLFYTNEPQQDYIQATFNSILQIHETQDKGDILAFLPGQQDIEDVSQLLKERVNMIPHDKLQLEVFTLYSALPSHLQLLAFQRQTDPNTRKVILSTNIAETSVTIDGIKYVVDCGLVKIRKYDPSKMVEILIIVPVSKSSAMQRAGRAGRQEPGKCFRLYTKETLDEQAHYMPPEIFRSNLSSTILQMKAIGINNVEEFNFLDKPKQISLKMSLDTLHKLHALNEQGHLTIHGREMAELPLDPILANFLLKSIDFKCVSEVISVISVLQVENLFYFPQDQRKNLLKILQRFQLGQQLADYVTQILEKRLKKRLKQQQQDQQKLQKINKNGQNNTENNNNNNNNKDLSQIKIDKSILKVTSYTDIKADTFIKCLITSMPMKVAKLNIDGSYTILQTNQSAGIHPESMLFYQKPKPEAVSFNEVSFTTKAYLRDLTEIPLADIQNIY
ncbi:P-loop containing nucleoside triphosphate hydrolase [Pseudocohnilembus persalinus]|uniref:RNA helicase n=1 Tax=Pseudocohnilembus persalinus TaxID=266149 RepID=A0A0V0QAZ3_PSEPJ|nr:P-loop containing nucleoside triphosphate hydrolase [Pseudocohnilembus persalinus]|eukprot:KRW99322.1 P-loop containing nucleoside triphosphate hydrolase [Pseudocohnilembus persalinus]